MRSTNQQEDTLVAPERPSDSTVAARRYVGWRRSWRVGRFVLLLTPLPLLVTILWLIWERTAEVPTGDEWVTVDLVQKYDRGALTLGDIWAYHYSHRIPIPRLVNLTIIELTHWNRQAEMTVNLAIAIGSALLIFWCVRRTFRSTDIMLVLIAPLSLLLFSLGQFDNWMAPFQIAFIATVFGVALCMWALITQPVSWWGMLLAILGAIIASLSSLGGLCIWFAFLPTLWSGGYRRARYFALWIGVALAVIIPYSRNFPTYSKTSVSPIATPVATLEYMLAFLGGPAGSLGVIQHPYAVGRSEVFGIGSILLMLINLAVYRVFRWDWKPIAGWLSLAIFALGCTAMTTLGRGADLGIMQALTPRYQVFSGLWWVALVVITTMTTVRLWETRRRSEAEQRRAVRWGIVGINLILGFIACIGFLQVNLGGARDGRVWMDGVRQTQSCVFNYQIAPDGCLAGHFFAIKGAGAVVRTRSAYLDTQRLGIFGAQALRLEDLSQTPQPTASSIDTVGDTIVARPHTEPLTVLQGSALTVKGWAIDMAAQRPAGAVFVRIDGVRHGLADYGGDRPDVSTALHNDAYRSSGFSIPIDTDTLSLGQHSLTIAVVRSDRTTYYAPPQQITIEIRSLNQLKKVPEPALSSIDTLSSTTVELVVVARPHEEPLIFPAHDPVRVTGWAADASAHTVAQSVFVSVDGGADLPTQYGFNRSDVAAVWGEEYLASGFEVFIPAGALAPGKHVLTIKMVPKDFRGYAASAQSVEIEIRP